MPKLPKLFSRFIFSSKNSTAVIDCFLTDRQKKFTELWAVFRSNLGKNQVLRFSLMHSFPRKNPVVTSTSVFKTRQKFYDKSQKIPRTTSETKKYSFFSKFTMSSKNSFVGINYIFESPLPKLSAKNQKTLHAKSESTLKKGIYWPIFHLVKKNAILKTLSKVQPIVSYSSAQAWNYSQNFGSSTLQQEAPLSVVNNKHNAG